MESNFLFCMRACFDTYAFQSETNSKSYDFRMGRVLEVDKIQVEIHINGLHLKWN